MMYSTAVFLIRFPIWFTVGGRMIFTVWGRMMYAIFWV